MKKLFILLSTLLSINIFAGYFHEKVDMRIQSKMEVGGIKVLEKRSYSSSKNNKINLSVSPINVTGLIKGNVYTSPEYIVYVGGEVSTEYHRNNEYIIKSIFYVAPSLVVGFEEEKENLKFYQQLALGLGYGSAILDSRYQFLNLKSKIEFGLNYNNVIFSLGLEPSLGIHSEYLVLHGNIALGLGYEF